MRLETSFAAEVSRAARGWNRALLAARVGILLGPCLAGAGMLVLLARLLGSGRPAAAGWLGLGVAAALVGGVLQARRRRVQPEQVAVMLDLRAGGTGRWLQAWEGGSPPSEPLPRTLPRPDGRRVFRALAPGGVFAALALAVPMHPLLPRDPLAQDPVSSQRLEELRDLAQRLAATVPLEEEFRTDVEERFRQLEQSEDESARGEARREALDRLEDKLSRRAEESAAALDQVAREMAAAGASLEQAPTDPAEARVARDSLAKALEQLARLGALGELPAGFEGLSPAEQLRTLEQLSRTGLERLAAEGLLDPSRLAQWSPGAVAAGDAPPDAASGAGLAAGTGDPREGALVGAEAAAGQGGVSRGPGAAQLDWGAETPDLAAEMQARALPPPANYDEAMRLLQTAGVTPRADGIAEAVAEAAAGGATGQASWQRRTAPHHREAVRRFFARKD